ncbi:MAG: tail fiber protein [Candidatus Adiutrix sp.]|jgi:hypothetical protein|nr:tail fiber protein [Candidatus Adiutrix sp.]
MTFTRIQFRRDSSAAWAATNPVLLHGEIGLIVDSLGTDTALFKIGDGVTPWNGLPVASGPPGAPGEDGRDGEKGDTPPLSDSVTSPDSNVAASSLAVKTAYDRAAEVAESLAALREAADALDSRDILAALREDVDALTADVALIPRLGAASGPGRIFTVPAGTVNDAGTLTLPAGGSWWGMWTCRHSATGALYEFYGGGGFVPGGTTLGPAQLGIYGGTTMRGFYIRVR